MKLKSMLSAWAGATAGGHGGELLVGLLLVDETISLLWISIGTPLVAFVLGSFFGVILGEVSTSPDVAKGVEGAILGTKHALAASAGGVFGVLLRNHVPVNQFTALPELTVAATGAAVGVVLGEILF